MNLHFISGLPRSGSTLLAAILRQNPRFIAGMSSPVSGLYRALEDAMARKNESAVFVSDEQRRAVLRGVFASYYGDGDHTIFDTSRMWCARTSAIAELFPDAKIICCVRDLAWIMDSFERLYRKSPFEPSGIYGFDTSGTIYSRTGMLGSSNGVVGFALDALREAMAGENSERLLLVEYDDLAKEPQETLERIYAFIGAQPFVHDFDHVEYSASEFDRQLGARGLHDVGGRVEWRPRKTILPPNLFGRFANDQFWRSEEDIKP